MNSDEGGVEPICEQLPIAPSVYYARQVSSGLGREQSDEELRVEIRLVHYL
jgi:putative transposase